MHIEPTLLGPVSALFGALIGSGASLVAAIYTQRYQDRIQRIASEVAKRETVYADFIMTGSNLLLNAYLRDKITLTGDEQRLVGLMNRMRLFAPPSVVDEAEAAFNAIIEILLKPSVDLGQLARAVLSKSQDPDPFLAFSLVCRADLDNVRRGASERSSGLFSNLLGLAQCSCPRSRKAAQPASFPGAADRRGGLLVNDERAGSLEFHARRGTGTRPGETPA